MDSSPISNPRPPRKGIFLLVGRYQGWLAALLLLGPGVIWIFQDRSVWPWDQSAYAEMAANLWWDLRHHHIWAWLSHMQSAFGNKAPGVSWLGQFFAPVGQALGSVETGLLLSVWLSLVLAVWLMYEVGRAIGGGNSRAGWLAAALTGVAPLTVAMGHQFFVEAQQLCAVSYVFWIAVALPGESRLRLAAHGLLAISFGMLAKATFPLYVLAPGLIITGRLWSECRRTPPPPTRKTPWGLLLLAGLAVVATADWYRVNFRNVLSFVQGAAAGKMALNYGHTGSLSSKMGYWLLSSQRAFIAPLPGLFLAATLVAAAALAIRHWRREGWPAPQREGSLAIASLLQVIFTLGVFSRQLNEETRYLLPMLPALVVPVVVLLMAGRSRLVLAGAAVALVWQFILVQQVSFGWRDPTPSLSPWLTPPQTDAQPRAEIERVIETTSGPGPSGAICGVELPWLNSNTLSFYAAKHRLETNQLIYYASLGYAPTDPDPVWKRLNELNLAYYVTLAAARQPQPPDFLNQIALEIQHRVEQSGQFERVPFASPLGIEIYRRRPTASP
jgi:hypothetical protein